MGRVLKKGKKEHKSMKQQIFSSTFYQVQKMNKQSFKDLKSSANDQSKDESQRHSIQNFSESKIKASTPQKGKKADWESGKKGREWDMGDPE